MKKVLALLLALSTTLSLVACSAAPAASQTQETTTAAETTAAETTAAETTAAETTAPETTAAEENSQEALRQAMRDEYLARANTVEVTDTHVIFTDDSGREPLSIEKNPQDVCILYGSHACLWMEAGGQVSYGVGGKTSAAYYKEQVGRDISQDEGFTVVCDSTSGKSWDVEQILAGKPGLIICSTQMTGYATISGPAEAAGIPVIALQYAGFEDYLFMFKVFCSLTEHEELWDSVAMEVLDQVIDFRMMIPEDVSTTALCFLSSEEGFNTYTSISETGKMMADLNAVNVVDQDDPADSTAVDISLEDLYAFNPECILIICNSDDEDASREKVNTLIGDSPVWEELDAVKNERVYYLPKALYRNRPNSKYVDAFKLMAECLYPEIDFD